MIKSNIWERFFGSKKKESTKSRGLRLEALEERQLLSAVNWNAVPGTMITGDSNQFLIGAEYIAYDTDDTSVNVVNVKVFFNSTQVTAPTGLTVNDDTETVAGDGGLDTDTNTDKYLEFIIDKPDTGWTVGEATPNLLDIDGDATNGTSYLVMTLNDGFSVSDFRLMSSATDTTQLGKLTTPVITSVIASAPGSLEVNFSTTNATSYRVYYGTAPDLSGAEYITNVSTTSPYTITGLDANTEYYVRLMGIDGNALREYSESAIFGHVTTSAQLPAPAITSTVPTANSMVVTWGEITGATGYEIQYKLTSESTTWSTWVRTGATTDLTETITSLDANTSYDFQVKAIAADTDNNSAWSATKTETTAKIVLSTPVIETSIAVTDTEATVTWAAIDNAASYDVQYRLVTDPEEDWSESVNVTVLTNTFTGLTRNTEYEFRVMAKAATDGDYVDSDWSLTEKATTDKTDLSTPVITTPIEVTDTEATVTWAAIDNAASYDVQYRLVTDPEEDWSESVNVTVLTNTFTGLTRNTEYEFRVMAKAATDGDYVDSDWSLTEKATTDKTDLSTPVITTPIEVTDTEATVTWAAIDNAASYDVQYRLVTDPEEDWSESVNVTVLTNTFTGLTRNTEYEFRVMAKAATDGDYVDSDWSLTEKATTDKTQLAIPIVATDNPFAAGAGFEISWEKVENADGGYEIAYTDGTDSGSVVAKAGATYCFVDGLNENTGYTITIKALAADGSNYKDSDLSTEYVLTTLKKVGLPNDEEVTTTPESSDTILVEWVPVPEAEQANITGYTVKAFNPDGSLAAEKTIEDSSAAEATIDGLEAGIEYTIEVIATPTPDAEADGAGDTLIATVTQATLKLFTYTVVGGNTTEGNYLSNYDAANHSITLSVTGYEEDQAYTLEYSTDNVNWGESPVFKNAMETAATVYYRLSAEGYQTVTGDRTVLINKVALSISGTSVADKDYDGGTSAVVTKGTITGWVNDEDFSDDVTATGTFADKNAASGINVEVIYSYTGNYTAPVTETLTADINKVALSISGTSVADKDYDGGTSAVVTKGTITGWINDEDFSDDVTATGTFADKNAASGINVEVIYSYTGNYTAPVTETLTADINKVALSISGTSVADKDYDGGTSAVVTKGTITGWVNDEDFSDDVTATGTFADKNAASGINVEVIYSYTGNYTAPVTETLTADINKVALSISGTSVADKDYDGGTSAVVTKGTITGWVNDEDFSDDVTATGTFADKNAASGINVEVIYSYTGNYTAPVTETLTADINKVALSISGTSVADKDYDGGTSAVVTKGTITGWVNDEDFSDDVTATGTFADKNAASGINVEVIYSYTGNYTAPVTETLTADINKVALSISGTSVADKDYDGGTSAVVTKGTITGWVNDEDFSDDVTATGTFADKNAASGINVEVIYSYTGNYTAPVTETLTADINKVALSISGTSVADKDYDGGTSAVVTKGTITGWVNDEDFSDDVTATGTFADKNAASGINVEVIYSYTGNYTAPVTETLTADINKVALSISGTSVADKDYDGGTSAVVTKGTITGWVNDEDFSDDVTATGTFADKNAASGINVEVIYSYTGNYTAPVTETLTADINKVQLTVTGTTVADKVYDGNTDAVVTKGTITGWVNDEDFSDDVTATGTFADKNAASGINVEVIYSYTGNYLAPADETIQANITAKPLDTPVLLDGSPIAEVGGFTASWGNVENNNGYEFTYTPEGGTATTIDLAEDVTTYQVTGADINAEVPYTFTIKALAAADSNYKDSEISETYSVTTLEAPSTLNWSIVDRGDFDYYRVDAADNLATLIGYKGNGATVLESEYFSSNDSTINIAGDNLKAENVIFGAGAMSDLGTINFNGGTTRLDTITVEGTENADLFTLDTATTTTINPVYTSNPYTNLINYYKDFYGEKSPIYQNIVKVFDDAYDRLGKIVSTTRTQANVIDLADGATLNFNGVSNAAIDAKGENDTVKINALGVAYDLSGNEGSDTLDFSAVNRVSIDMGSTNIQYAVPGQIGSIRLNNDFENVTGSTGSDYIVSFDTTEIINGNGGSDTIVLDGSAEEGLTVNLEGRSSVLLRADGDYTVIIDNADFSIVNGLAGSENSSIELYATGDHVFFYGTRGNDVVDIDGDYAYANTYAGDDSVYISGSNATVLAGAGNDYVEIAAQEGKESKNNIVYGENGDDTINLFGTTKNGNNFVYAGFGNDIVIGGEGNDFIYGMAGNNVLIGNIGDDRIFGGTGRDIIMASGTQKLVDAQDKKAVLDAVMAEWTDADPDLDVIFEQLGKESIKDGSRDWLYRGGGSGKTGKKIVYSNSSEGDFASVLTFNPFNDVLLNDLHDED